MSLEWAQGITQRGSNIFGKSGEEELMICFGSRSPDVHVEHSLPAKFLVKKNGLGLLRVQKEKKEEKKQSQTRTPSRGRSPRLLSHRSGTEQKIPHKLYRPGQSPPCFCNCLRSPAQKIKAEQKRKRNWALMMMLTKKSRDKTTKGEKCLVWEQRGQRNHPDVFLSRGHAHGYVCMHMK